MMLHRHFEEENASENMTKLRDVNVSSDTTNPDDPLYVPVEDDSQVERKTKRGRPAKEESNDTD